MAVEAEIHAALMDQAISLDVTPSMPKAFAGVSSDVRNGDYLEIIHLPNEPIRTELESARPMDQSGFLQVQIFRLIAPNNWDILSKVIAGQIATHFARGLVLTYSATKVKVVKCWAGQGRKDPNGTHWQTPVFIEYVQIS